MRSSQQEVTELLRAWRSGDDGAYDQLFSLVYDQLHLVAGNYMRKERPSHTLRPTALLHEAYLRLVDAEVDWADRTHFMAVCCLTMRRILVDYARQGQRAKRGNQHLKLSLDEVEYHPSLSTQPYSADILDINAALTRLEVHDSRKAKMLEFVYFGGFSYQETSAAMNLSELTVSRELRLAKAWLRRELNKIAAEKR